MAILTDYTTYDTVRAVLGVAEEELEDATLGLPMYLQQLQMSMEGIHTEVIPQYAAIRALDPASRTSVQQRFFDVVQVYSAYAISMTLLSSARLFAPQSVTDGRAQQQRFADPFDRLRDDVRGTLTDLKRRLESALEALGFSVDARSTKAYFSTAPLVSDPVTNI